MGTPSLQSLVDLCSIHFAYLLRCRYDNISSELEEKLKKLLSKKVASLVLSKMIPVGEGLVSLRCLWQHHIQSLNSRELLDMLFECITLDGVGLINRRKTAEKLLSSKMLNDVSAFRLACINFLKEDVLKLWDRVKEHYLNKILVECDQSRALREEYRSRNEIPKSYRCHDHQVYNYIKKLCRLSPFQRTTEPQEVLFWISYCLSKENAIDIIEIPHFSGNADWNLFSVESAAFHGNVACFDYFENSYNGNFKYDYVDTIEKIFRSKTKHQQSCFIFLFMLLNPEEKKDLFEEFTIDAVSHFLQWPLSLTFQEEPEMFLNFIPEEYTAWVFQKILSILLSENTRVTCKRNIYFVFNMYDTFKFRCHGVIDGIYNIHHLKGIWTALWDRSSESHKLMVLESIVLKSTKKSMRSLKLGIGINKVVQKLQDLFLSNGEAVLELYKSKNMEESLRSLLAKYMPEDFEDLNTKSSSSAVGETTQKKTKQTTNLKTKQTTNSKTKQTTKTKTKQTTKTKMKQTNKAETTKTETNDTTKTEVDMLSGEYKVVGSIANFTPINSFTPIHDKFLNYIKNNVSWNRS